MDERARIELLRRVLASTQGSERVALGIGDDAALLRVGGEQLACSVDVAVEGTHFRRHWLTWKALGYRSTMTAASDLAAMAASPLGVLSSLVLPRDLGDAALEGIATGQREACDELGCAVVGGNLARGGELSLTTAVLGCAGRPLRRDAARVGDRLWLCGALGLAAAGLALLLAERDAEPQAPPAALDAWRRPRARIAEGLRVADRVCCGIDVSDGLARDAEHIAEASAVSIVLDGERLVSAELAAAAAFAGRDPVELALAGGEDYALLVSAPPEVELEDFEPIGRVEARGGSTLWLAHGSALEPIDARGFDHFA
jgi:thiamine-monophosphate kinase